MNQLPPGIAGALNSGAPVKPRPSASVVLVRGSDPWEVLLMRRPREVDFAASAHVFPGGSVHEEDQGFADAFRAAAIRELFEEVGILLALREGEQASERAGRELRALAAAGTPWAAALRRLELEPAFDALTFFARWVTPAQLRRRFDTRFFLARTPPEQAVEPNPAEVAEWLWISPAAALESRSIELVYATREILAALAAERDSERLIAQFKGRRRIRTVRPHIVETPGGWTIVR